MEAINLKDLLLAYKADKDEVAKLLFPNTKYPTLAFRRVLKDEALLDTKQAALLASYLGISVADLYTTFDWSAKFEQDSMVFIKGNKKVVLTNGFEVKVFEDSVLVNEAIINAKGLSLSEFILYINQLTA